MKAATTKTPTRGQPALHVPTVSAVLEYCICGQPMTDLTVHTMRGSRAKVQVTGLAAARADVIGLRPMVMVHLAPDVPISRDLVSRTMGWKFQARVKPGLWNVEPTVVWPEQAGMTCSIKYPLATGYELDVTVSVAATKK